MTRMNKTVFLLLCCLGIFFFSVIPAWGEILDMGELVSEEGSVITSEHHVPEENAEPLREEDSECKLRKMGSIMFTPMETIYIENEANSKLWILAGALVLLDIHLACGIIFRRIYEKQGREGGLFRGLMTGIPGVIIMVLRGKKKET